MEISEEKLDELKELYYLQGERSALVQQLRKILEELYVSYDGEDDGAPANLIAIARMTTEREATISALRTVCESHGDNDWDANLHMVDIINKHLANHLNENPS